MFTVIHNHAYTEMNCIHLKNKSDIFPSNSFFCFVYLFIFVLILFWIYKIFQNPARVSHLQVKFDHCSQAKK